MMNLHDELRQIFAEDAEQAPRADSLAFDVRRQVRRGRLVRAGLVAGSLVAAASIAIAAVGASDLGGSTGQPDDLVAGADAVQGKGAVPDGDGRCVEEYTAAAAIEKRAFAFDGTVSSIDDEQPGEEDLGLVSVTFEVNEWFTGGSEETVTIAMFGPGPDHQATYEVGTRLLVSGTPQWGGVPLENPIAWGCGFTRYYDEGTAHQWSDVPD